MKINTERNISDMYEGWIDIGEMYVIKILWVFLIAIFIAFAISSPLYIESIVTIIWWLVFGVWIFVLLILKIIWYVIGDS